MTDPPSPFRPFIPTYEVRLTRISDKTWALFQEIVVPAVLGNTVWSGLSVILRGDGSPTGILKCVAIVLLTTYFLGEWWFSRDNVPVIRHRFFPAVTAAFYVLIATYAIALALESTVWLPTLILAAFFVTTALGHHFRVWRREGIDVGSGSEDARLQFVRACGAALFIVCVAVIAKLAAGVSDGLIVLSHVFALAMFVGTWASTQPADSFREPKVFREDVVRIPLVIPESMLRTLDPLRSAFWRSWKETKVPPEAK